MRLALALSVILLVPLGARAESSSPGLEHFYNLEYDQAIADFKRDIAESPDRAENYNHLAMAILYREMLRCGALESELVSGTNPFLRRARVNPSAADQAEFDEAIRKSMGLSQARLKSDPRDIKALYTQGVAFGLRANYNFLVRKAWMDSLRDATTARKLHNRVTAADPSMIDARLMQGVHDYVVGSLPWHIKLVGFLAGFRGDKQGGIRTLEDVAAHGDMNRVDAEVLLCAVYRRERLPRKAVPLLEALIQRCPRNYLFRFELAQMYADLGDKSKALAAIQRVEDLKRSGDPGYAAVPPEKVFYARGTVQFWYRDLDQAEANFLRVTSRAHELDLNTGTFAWLRLGQIYDLKGRRKEAVEAYQRAVRLAPESDAAKLSSRYIAVPYRRGNAGG
ncbi:MAG: tetratricopeptide repeat protein [Bryobacteraceae bacterium]